MLKKLFLKFLKGKSKYRQNVGIIIIKNGKIWSGHRIDRPLDDELAWQMPQGGIEENESILEAGYREMLEETGIKKDDVNFITILQKTTKYNFSKEAIKSMKKKNYNNLFYKGQEQYWVVFQFNGKDEDINLNLIPNDLKEFNSWKWSDKEFLLTHCIDFKIKVYKKVFDLLNKLNLDN